MDRLWPKVLDALVVLVSIATLSMAVMVVARQGQRPLLGAEFYARISAEMSS